MAAATPAVMAAATAEVAMGEAVAAVAGIER
jgi:hypothetical protein